MKSGRLLLLVLAAVALGLRLTASTANFAITKSTTAGMSWWVVTADATQGPPAGSMIAAPNYSSTTSTGTVYTGSLSTTTAGSILIYGYVGSVPTGYTLSQRQALGPYLAGTVTWAAGATGWLTTTDLTGTSPTSYTKYTYSKCFTNTTAFVVNARMTYAPTGGTPTTEAFSMQPGQVRCYSIEQTNAFTVNMEVETVLPDGMGTGWVGNAENPTSTNTVSSPPTPTNSGATSNGNIWNSQDATNRLGAPPVATETTQTRTDTSASTGDTLQRQMESNQEKRHAELKSLLVAQDRNQGIRDAVALDALNLGLNRLNASVWGAGLSVSNAVAGLRSSLEGGTNGAALGVGTNVTAGAVQSGAGAAATALGGLIPTVTIPAGTAPVLTLPFHHLHADLEDAEFDFGDETLAPIVTTVRAVELVGVTVLFFVMSLKLFGRTANV